MCRTLSLVLLTSLSCGAILAQTMIDQATRRGDDSDWWSIIRQNVGSPTVQPQKRVPGDSNFSILGVALGDPQGTQLASKLGKAAIVARGDAGTARAQMCYVSQIESSPAVHLIFEQGEVEYAFYLFSDGPNWRGSNLCAKSALVSTRLRTGAGLMLGQTPAQVKAILGKPTAIRRDELTYYDQVLIKPADHNDSYYLTAYIDARFSNGRLTYLGVMKSETD